MKRILFIGLMLMGFKVYADDNAVASFSFNKDSKTISISTTPSQPTQIFTKDFGIQRNYLITTSSFTIWISSINVTISTSSTSGFPSLQTPGTITNPFVWSPDGPTSVYNGGMWAVSDPSQAVPTVSIIRIK